MPKLAPCLWFDENAEAAAEYYVSVFPNSRITSRQRSAADNPSVKEGAVLAVEFELDGNPFMALNGGPNFTINEAVSFVVDCADQAEMDRYYDALSAVPASEQCGWVKDTFGVSWQIVPKHLAQLLSGPRGKHAMEALLKMKRLNIAALETA